MTRKEIEDVFRRTADRVSLELPTGLDKNAYMRLLLILEDVFRRTADRVSLELPTGLEKNACMRLLLILAEECTNVKPSIGS